MTARANHIWDTTGAKTIPELETMLGYASRVGFSVVERSLAMTRGSEVSRYLKQSGLLEAKPDLLRMDVLSEDADEPRLIEGIRSLISE